jgi:hypothetical protein
MQRLQVWDPGMENFDHLGHLPAVNESFLAVWEMMAAIERRRLCETSNGLL